MRILRLPNWSQPKVCWHYWLCWHVHYKCPKHSSLVWAVRMEWTDKENCIAVIALHKCGIERARIFEILKPLNNTRVFVYHAVKLLLDTGGVSDCKRSSRPRMVCMPQVINAVRWRINRKQKIMAWEMDIVLKIMSGIIKQDLALGAFKRQTGQFHCIKRK